MSNNVLTSTIGLDNTIQRLQTKVYDFLNTRWSGTLEAYGRAYKNIDKKGNFKYEWYNSREKDYQDVYYNDSSSDGVFFFIESGVNDADTSISFNSTIKMVFMCNLKKIFSTYSNERNDEESHRDVMEAIRNANLFPVSGVETDIQTIFSGVDTEKIKFSNIHPLHCFSINLSVNYYLTDKCN